MYSRRQIETDRLTVSYYRAGEGNERKMLLLHGNLSSSLFFLPLFPELEKKYDIAAPDLRCFGDTESKPVDATRGYRDWSDDVFAFCRTLGWERFLICGWSLGGNIAMQYTVDHAEQVEKLILIAPGSPYGFGGTRDEIGTPHEPVGLGSGGGCVNPTMLMLTASKSRLFLREILRKYYFNAPFRMDWTWENRLIAEIAKTRIGQDQYPGNFVPSSKWPHVAAGDRGVLNTMAPQYANLSALLNVPRKPPVLWLRGKDDKIVSDHSTMELGYLGQIGLVPGWPGASVYPPQPMIAQTRHFFAQYASGGGTVREAVIPGGHLCALESPAELLAELNRFALGDTDH